MPSSPSPSPSPWSTRFAARLPRAVLPALVAAVVAFGSCTTDQAIDVNIPNILVIVNVHGVLADVTSLQVRAALNGKSDPVGLNITNNTSQFALTLPNAPQSLGTLRIDGYGLDNHQCYQASGSITTQLVAGNTYQELVLTLNSVGARLCQLDVDLTGTGAVTSTPPGISCGGGNTVCSFGFAYGTAVTLAGPISAQSYPVWSANCVSGGAQSVTCKIATLGQGEQHVAATFVPRSCGPGGFCQYNPLPSSYAINGLWGSGPKDVWAVGTTPSTIMHYDGSVWTAAANPNLNPLTRIWGSGPTDVWALGGSSLLHYGGSAWSAVSGSGLATFNSGATTGPTNIWVAGDSGQVVHFDGNSWTPAFSAPEVWSSMWAGSPSDIWGLNAAGSLYHYNGQAVTKDPSPLFTGKTLTSLWGTAPNDVWVASLTEVFRWDGTAWTAQVTDSGVMLGGISGSGGAGGPDAWFAATSGRVFHHKGTADCLASHTCWSLAPTPSMFTGVLRAIWGSSASDLWAAGDFGGISHFDGSQWKLDPSVGGSNQNLLGVFVTAVNINVNPVVSSLANTQIITYDNAVGINASSAPTGMAAIYGVTVGTANEIWAVGGANTILRSTDGKAFAAPSGVTTPAGTHTALTGVWITTASTSNRTYFVTGDNGYVARWDGAAWTQLSCPATTATLKSIHGSGTSGTNLYAVGTGGTFFNINIASGACTAPLMPAPTTNFTGVFNDGTNVWVVGDNGTVAGYTPGSKALTPITAGTTVNLTGVWAGGNKTPVWVVGNNGTILSCETTGCTAQPTGLNVNFRGVWGANSTDIWAVGNSGTLLRLKM